MGKIKEIQKSRKECKCGKCGNIIPVGSKYLRGILNFHPDIIRCTNCGLKYWEVTTSDYVQRVAPILNEWQEQGYSYEDILSEFTDLKDELQERLDNMLNLFRTQTVVKLFRPGLMGWRKHVASWKKSPEMIFSVKNWRN